jgi:hypothetical protein
LLPFSTLVLFVIQISLIEILLQVKNQTTLVSHEQSMPSLKVDS